MTYRLTQRAQQGLFRIVIYTEEYFGPELADRVLRGIVEAFETIATHPDLGHAREDLT